MVAVVLLYRNLAKIRGLSAMLLGCVLLTIAWAVVTALLHGHIGQAVEVFCQFAYLLIKFPLMVSSSTGVNNTLLFANDNN